MATELEGAVRISEAEEGSAQETVENLLMGAGGTDEVGVAKENGGTPGGAESTGEKVLIAVLIAIIGLAMGGVALIPNAQWPPAWGNFFGAFIVAVGGLLGCLHAANLGPERFVSWSWSCIVVGGFVIAGASLQTALA